MIIQGLQFRLEPFSCISEGVPKFVAILLTKSLVFHRLSFGEKWVKWMQLKQL